MLIDILHVRRFATIARGDSKGEYDGAEKPFKEFKELCHKQLLFLSEFFETLLESGDFLFAVTLLFTLTGYNSLGSMADKVLIGQFLFTPARNPSRC